jgi:hypothetical protein
MSVVSNLVLAIFLPILVLGLAGETILYGLARLLPGSYYGISHIMPVVLACKMFYFIGLVFGVAWAIKMRTQTSYLGTVLGYATALWALAWAVLQFVNP